MARIKNARRMRRNNRAKSTRTSRKKKVTRNQKLARASRTLTQPLKTAPVVSYKSLIRPKIMTWMKYCDTKRVEPDAGMAHHVFKINNLYDPDHTGLGHQPLFHDQWALLYNNYRVTYAEVTCKFRPHPLEDKLVHEHLVAYGLNVGESIPVTTVRPQRNHAIHFMEIAETAAFPFTEAADLNAIREGAFPSGGSVKWSYGPKSTLTMKVPIEKYTALIESLVDPVPFGSNPVNSLYLAVGAMSPDGGTVYDVAFDITIKFLCELSDHKANIGES